MSLRGGQIIKMGKAGVSRGLTGAELCALSHQKQQDSQKNLKGGGRGLAGAEEVRETGTEKEGNGCSAGFVAGGAVRPRSKKDLGPEARWSPSHAA